MGHDFLHFLQIHKHDALHRQSCELSLTTRRVSQSNVHSDVRPLPLDQPHASADFGKPIGSYVVESKHEALQDAPPLTSGHLLRQPSGHRDTRCQAILGMQLMRLLDWVKGMVSIVYVLEEARCADSK
jgi:hypothetical protein